MPLQRKTTPPLANHRRQLTGRYLLAHSDFPFPSIAENQHMNIRIKIREGTSSTRDVQQACTCKLLYVRMNVRKTWGSKL